MSPKRTNLVLSSYIPDSEWNVLVFDSFDIETCTFLLASFLRWAAFIHTNSGNSCHNFTQFKLVQDGGLTSGIKTNHEDTHLSLTKELREYRRETNTHFLLSFAWNRGKEKEREVFAPRGVDFILFNFGLISLNQWYTVTCSDGNPISNINNKIFFTLSTASLWYCKKCIRSVLWFAMQW